MPPAHKPRRNGDLVTVAHMDDAIAASLLLSTGVIQDEIDDLKNDVNDLRTQVVAALARLDARPIRKFMRWVLKEARALHAAAAGAVVSGAATYALFHFL